MIFYMTFQSLETLYCKLISQREGDDTNLPKADAEKDLLRVLSYKAESVSKKSTFNTLEKMELKIHCRMHKTEY